MRDLAVSVDPGAVVAAAGYPRDSGNTAVENEIERVIARHRLRLAYRRDPLAVGNGRVKIGGDLLINSVSLAHFFEGCNAALLVASTLGAEISDETRRLSHSGRMDEAYLLDVIASQMADAGLGMARRLASRHLLRRGEWTTRRRFSPGYGDVDLSLQLPLFHRLQLQELGLSILPSYMLVPKKTVVAFWGIGRMTR